MDRFREWFQFASVVCFVSWLGCSEKLARVLEYDGFLIHSISDVPSKSKSYVEKCDAYVLYLFDWSAKSPKVCPRFEACVNWWQPPTQSLVVLPLGSNPARVLTRLGSGQPMGSNPSKRPASCDVTVLWRN